MRPSAGTLLEEEAPACFDGKGLRFILYSAPPFHRLSLSRGRINAHFLREAL